MADKPIFNYQVGLPKHQFHVAALLYDEAFGRKFAVAIRSQADRVSLLEQTFVGEFAVTASAGNELIGLAGFHTREGTLTGGIGAKALFRRLGVLRGLRAIAVFSLYERKPKPGELLMDGIAVLEAYRGRGVGTQLLSCIVDYARVHRFDTVRLDVIDSNPGAQKLYERFGFAAVRVERFPYLRWLLGFGASTTMEFRIASTV